MKPKTWLHDGSIGDVIASIPAIKEYYDMTGHKSILYLRNNQKAFYYATEGNNHPTKNPDTNDMVMLNEKAIGMLIPLLKEQECFEDVKIFSNQAINVDLNQIRTTNVGMPNFCISRWYFYKFPDLACDLSKQWLNVPDSCIDLAKGKILVTRTERYLNPNISYNFLKKYEKDVVFSGTDVEYVIFKTRYDLDIPKLQINNFLELAQAIKQSKFHISNQTMAFQISQGIKHPRILELCEFAPNVIVIGENAYDFFSQEGLELYVKVLNGETKKRRDKYPAHTRLKDGTNG